MWSAAATNNAMVMDLVGVGTAIVTEGTTVPVVIAAKVLLAIFDNAIDTYIPTDLYDLRITTQTRLIESGTNRSVTVEGLFAAENPAVNGTLELFIGVAIANLKLPESKIAPIQQALINDLGSKVGGQLIKEFWTAVLPVVDDPESPCDGKIGGWWQRLDLHLYSSTDWDTLADKALYNDYYYWLDYYYAHGINEPHPDRVVTVDPDWVELDFDRYNDVLHFNHPGKYMVTIRCFSFSDTQSNWWLWSHTGLKDVVLEEPYWVDRWGDWQNTRIAPGEIDWTRDNFAVIAQDVPVIVYHTYNIPTEYMAIHATSPDATEWSEPVTVLVGCQLLDLEVINGLPVVFYIDGDTSERCLKMANNANGSSWPVEGVVVANTYMTSGTHTGYAISNRLIDDAASFVSSGIEYGDWVQINSSGVYVHVVNVLSETELTTVGLPDGGKFTAGTGYTIYRNGPRTSRCQLSIKGGVPVLLYYSNLNLNDTYYVEALDWQGNEWGEPQLAGQDTGYRCDPVFIDGRPAYITNDYYEGVHYRIANDSNGYTWGSSQPITSEDTWGQALADVNGTPAICLSYRVPAHPDADVETVDEMYYLAATSADGTAWLDQVKIGRALERPYANNMGEAAIRVINGKPRVAFYQVEGTIAYIESLDGMGYTWNEPVKVSYGNTADIFLFEFLGGPAVCHYSAGDDGMMWSVPDL